MAKTVFEVLIDKCKEAIESREQFLAGGGPKDFPEYREVVGVIRGLALMQREIQDLSRNYMEADDD